MRWLWYAASNMQIEKITQLIKQENDEREQEVSDTARQLIRGIGEETLAIEAHNQNIKSMREELKALEHVPVLAAQIIG